MAEPLLAAVGPRGAALPSHATHTHTHTLSHWDSVDVLFTLQVHLWGVGGNPHRHGENVQTTHRVTTLPEIDFSFLIKVINDGEQKQHYWRSLELAWH